MAEVGLYAFKLQEMMEAAGIITAFIGGVLLPNKEDPIKIGDLVYDKGLKQKGLVIEVINSVVPYRVFYEDGHIDIACDHDLELIDGYLV